jgi:hypothetical protein
LLLLCLFYGIQECVIVCVMCYSFRPIVCEFDCVFFTFKL